MALFDDLISGDDSADLDGSDQVHYAIWHTTTIGFEARPLESGSPDHVLRLGWFALAFHGTDIDDVARDYWDPPVWLDFLNGRWHPVPAFDTSGGTGVWATRIRWHISAGAEVHLLVN